MLPAVLTTIFFSISAVTGNRTAKVMGGVEANFWRLTLAAVLLTIYVLSCGQSIVSVAFSLFVISGIVGIGIGDGAFFQALPRLGSRLTILIIQCLSVPIAAVIEWLWLGTSLGTLQVVFIGMVLLGTVIALKPAPGNKPISLKPGIVFGAIAAFGNGFGAVLSRKAYQISFASGESVDGAASALQRIFGGLLVGGLCLLAVKYPLVKWEMRSFESEARHASHEKWRLGWRWVIATSLAGQTLGVTCLQWALKNNPAGVVLPVVALTPLVALPFTRFVEGERAGFRSILGGIVAVAGVIALITSTTWRHH